MQQRNKNHEPNQLYKTESELKAEAAQRMEEQRLIEAARKPRSEPAKKAENFFYHNKWLVIVLCVAFIVISLFIRDIFFTPKADFMVIAVSAHSITYDRREEMSNALSGYMTQSRGDTLVTMDAIALPPPQFSDYYLSADEESLGSLPDAARMEMDYANIMKLSAMIAANDDPIFLLDAAGFGYLARMGTPEEIRNIEGVDYTPYIEGFFYPLNAGGDNIYALPVERLGLTGGLGEDFSGMSFYLRDWSQNEKKAAKFGDALEFLMRFAG